MKKETKWVSFVFGMYVIVAALLIYTILAESGLIAPSETGMLLHKTAISCMILCLRMFFVKKNYRGDHKGNVVKFTRGR